MGKVLFGLFAFFLAFGFIRPCTTERLAGITCNNVVYCRIFVMCLISHAFVSNRIKYSTKVQIVSTNFLKSSSIVCMVSIGAVFSFLGFRSVFGSDKKMSEIYKGAFGSCYKDLSDSRFPDEKH